MPEHLSSILDSTEPTLLTTGWGRTEGPLWHAAGYVTFVNLAPSGRTLLISDMLEAFPTASSYPQVCQHELCHGLCPSPVRSRS